MLFCHFLNDFIVYPSILFLVVMCSSFDSHCYDIILNICSQTRGHLIFISIVFLKLYTCTEKGHTSHFKFNCSSVISYPQINTYTFWSMFASSFHNWNQFGWLTIRLSLCLSRISVCLFFILYHSWKITATGSFCSVNYDYEHAKLQ